MPDSLSEADPLVLKLITSTANDVAADMNSVDAWARHATALLANGYNEGSVATSRIALSINPEGRLPLRYRQAFALWILNQQEEAISELMSVLDEMPMYDYGWRRLSTWHLERGELSAAEDAINRAWDIAPNRPGTLATLVRILMQQDQPDLAISRLTPRLNQKNTPPYLYFLASQAYRRLGETDSMQSAAVKGERLPANWPDPLLTVMSPFVTGSRALALKAIGVMEKKGLRAALGAFKLAFDANPADSQIRGLYALSLMIAKREVRALEVISGIEDTTDISFMYWVSYGQLSVLKAKKDNQTTWLLKAKDCYEKAESITGGTPHIYQLMAQLAIAMKNPDEASKYYEVGAELLIAEGEIQEAKILLGEGISAISEDETLQTMLEELMKTQ